MLMIQVKVNVIGCSNCPNRMNPDSVSTYCLADSGDETRKTIYENFDKLTKTCPLINEAVEE